MTVEEILRGLLQENATAVGGFEPKRVGGYPPLVPPSAPEMAGGGEIYGPPTPPPERRSRVLDVLQRIAYGLVPAQTPLSRNAGTARAQMALRGLAHGFQKSRIAEMAQANRYGDEPGGGEYRGPNASGGGSRNPLADELLMERILEVRGRRTKPDLDAERDIDAFVGREGRAEAKSKADIERIGASAEAQRALARRRDRPDQPRAAGGGGGRGGKGGATYAGERAQLKARRDAEIGRHAGIAAQMEKGEGAAYLGRRKAEINEQYKALLADLDARYGVTHNTAESASGALPTSGKSTLDILNGTP